MDKTSQLSATAVAAANPFPPTAVRRHDRLTSNYVTVTTEAMATASRYLSEYLAATSPEGWSARGLAHGNVIAILGEYGTGKTHLALELAARLSEVPDTHFYYLDAPGDSFLSLYRERFVPQLDQRDLNDRIVEYYADIIAEELAESELTGSVAARLRTRELDPDAVVARIGLAEASFKQILNRRLSSVTEKDDFGTALSLFLRPEYRATVWDWLRGNEPDPVLIERGIERTINSDVEALEALGVFALLFGSQRHRFVLIIDEMEKILSAKSDRRLEGAAVLAFKRLLEVTGRSGALLIICGLPDFFEALPADTQQRVPFVVRPTRLTTDDTIKFIERSQEVAFGTGRLAPFSDDVAAYLNDLAGGNARRVVRLCYLAFQASVASQSVVTRALVRAAARDQYDALPPTDFEAAVVRIIDRNGWPRERDKEFRHGKTRRRADLWLPLSDGSQGCAIFLAQSILQEEDVNRLLNRSAAVRQSAKDGEHRLCLLAVNGYVAESLNDRLQRGFDRVEVYCSGTFFEDLETTIRMEMQSLESGLRDDAITLISTRVDQIFQQASSLSRQLEMVMAAVTRPITYELATQSALERVFGRLAGDRSASVDTRFPRVNRVFADARELLERARQDHERILTGMFESKNRDMPMAVPDRYVTEGSLILGVQLLVNVFERAVYGRLAVARVNRTETASTIRQSCEVADRVLRDSRVMGELEEIVWYVGRQYSYSSLSPEVDLPEPGRRLEMISKLGEHVFYASRADLDALHP